VYTVSQLVLVVRTLDDRWVIGDIIFGIAFYVVGCVLLFAFSTKICDAVSHYIDGVFFFSLCMLLTVMMVYKVSQARCKGMKELNDVKYWDSITKEDLEFSVGSKQAVWEVKEPLVQVSYTSPTSGLFADAHRVTKNTLRTTPHRRTTVRVDRLLAAMARTITQTTQRGRDRARTRDMASSSSMRVRVRTDRAERRPGMAKAEGIAAAIIRRSGEGGSESLISSVTFFMTPYDRFMWTLIYDKRGPRLKAEYGGRYYIEWRRGVSHARL
jgi:hypothetical protein